jgi:hypothetical protein
MYTQKKVYLVGYIITSIFEYYFFYGQVAQATPWLPLLPSLSHWHDINHTRHKNSLHNDTIITE